MRALRDCKSGVKGPPAFNRCAVVAGRPKGVVGTERVVVDRLSNRPGGEPRRDNDPANCEICGGSTTNGVEEADILPARVLTEKSSGVVEIVRLGFVTVRLSVLEASPSGPRELPLKWGHSADFSRVCCERCARSKAADDLDTCDDSKGLAGP
jgi:hypothetical protein